MLLHACGEGFRPVALPRCLQELTFAVKVAHLEFARAFMQFLQCLEPTARADIHKQLQC